MSALLVILSVLKKIPYQVYVLIGLLFLIWLYGHWQYRQGQAEVQDRWNAAIAKGREIIADLKAKQLTVNMQIDTVYQERTEFIYSKGETIVKEIPHYIPVGTPDLPSGFRVLHDAAVRSTVPTSAESIGAAPVRVADATETIVNNYTTCHVIQEEVVAWRKWYQEQSRIWQTVECR